MFNYSGAGLPRSAAYGACPVVYEVAGIGVKSCDNGLELKKITGAVISCTRG
jgi:hypothetical protein